MQGCVGSKANTNTSDSGVWFDPPEDTIVNYEVKQDLPAINPVITTTAYSVQKGDTITGIAGRYGLRWQDVVAVNPGIMPNRIQVGQVIQLPGQVNLSRPAVTAPRPVAPAPAPSRTETVYVVKSGDTISEIALKHGVKTAAILEANGLKDANKISVGQKLKIPGAQKSTATVAPRPAATPPKATPPRPAENRVAAPTPAPAPAPVVTPPPPVVVKDDEDAAPEAAVTPAPTAGKTHTVKAGEDLYTVAVRWGVSPSDLRALNKLTSPDLQEGMVLIIPASASAQ